MTGSEALAMRERLVARARQKPAAPYTLDERLTFFSPQENLEALELPVVERFHRWAREEWTPSGSGPAVLLLLPCQREKPYTLSAEHRAVNARLIERGFSPAGRGDWPQQLAGTAPGRPAAAAAPQLLSNAPLSGHGLRIDRAVVSEPFGLVPYEAIYRWQGELSPCARYDDPGLFEHRGIGCPWREDSTCVRRGGRWLWRDRERQAYVEVHNRLAEQIAATLHRVAARYIGVIAYVAPSLTHRTFLADAAERAAAGMPLARRAGGRPAQLIGVGDMLPGLVQLVPDAADLDRLRAARGGRLGARVLEDEDCLDLLVAKLTAAVNANEPTPEVRV